MRRTLRAEHFPLLKNNVLLANAGHFWEEIDVSSLAKLAVLMPGRYAKFEASSGWIASYLSGEGLVLRVWQARKMRKPRMP